MAACGLLLENHSKVMCVELLVIVHIGDHISDIVHSLRCISRNWHAVEGKWHAVDTGRGAKTHTLAPIRGGVCGQIGGDNPLQDL